MHKWTFCLEFFILVHLNIVSLDLIKMLVHFSACGTVLIQKALTLTFLHLLTFTGGLCLGGNLACTKKEVH